VDLRRRLFTESEGGDGVGNCEDARGLAPCVFTHDGGRFANC